MPSKTSKTRPAATLPSIPKEFIDQMVSGPMSAEAINADLDGLQEGIDRARRWVPNSAIT